MVISRLFTRASLENPSVSLADWDDETLTASSGDKVTHASALRLPPFFRALDLISGDIAKLPLNVYARSGDGKVRATGHQAYNLLRYKTNADQTAFAFKRALAYQALLGNAYALIERSDTGRVQSLMILDAKRTHPVRMGGELWYVYETDNGARMKFERSEILHIRGLSWDGVTGHNTLDVMRETLGAGLAARKYGSKFFANNGRPSMILEHPGSFRNKDIADRLRKDWDRIHKGLDNAHRVAILEEGMKARPITGSAKDSMLIEASEFSLIEVANFFGIPPHKLGHTARTSYSSLEQENQAYLDQCLDHWLVQIEQEARDKLLTERQKATDSHVIEFNREALISADMASKADFFRTALGGAPWMTINEVRSKLNMAGFDDIGTELILPSNNFQQALDVPLENEEPSPAPDETAPSEDEDNRAQLVASAEAMRAQVVARMTRRVAGDARRAAKDRAKFAAWLDEFAANHRAVIIEAMAPICGMLQALGIDTDTDTEAERIFGRFDALAAQLDEPGEITQRIASYLQDLENMQ